MSAARLSPLRTPEWRGPEEDEIADLLVDLEEPEKVARAAIGKVIREAYSESRGRGG